MAGDRPGHGRRPSFSWRVRHAWRSLVDLLGLNVAAMPEPDLAFVAEVRALFDPVAASAGLSFSDAGAGLAASGGTLSQGPELPPTRADFVPHTNVLYEGVPAEFAARFRGWDVEVVPDDPCVDLWIELDMDSGLVEVHVERFRHEVARDRLGTAAVALQAALDAARTDDA